MTDEATPIGGAESPAVVSEKPEAPKRGSVEALKAMVWGKPPAEPAKAETSEPAPEGKPAPVEASQEPDPEIPSEDANPEPTEPESSAPDLKTVAKMLGVSPSELVIDDDGTLAFKTKVDGQEGKARLDALRKSFQLDSAATRRFMDLSEKERAFKAEQEQRTAELTARAQQTDQYLDLAHRELLREFHGTDWASLQATDPVEFSSKWIAFQQRQAQLNQALESRRSEALKAQEAATTKEQERLASEFKELLNHVPSWGEESVRKAGQKEVADFLKGTYSFTDGDVAAVASSNHKALRIVLDALEYHKHKQSAAKAKAEVLKKVDAAPKMAKAGVAASQDSEARKISQLRVAMKKGDKTAGIEFLKRTVFAKTKQR